MNKPHLHPAPPRPWSTPLLVLCLAALVVASFATLRLDLAAFFTPDAVGTTLNAQALLWPLALED